MSGGYEIVLWILLIVASATDLLWGKIYNHLTFSSIAIGVVTRLVLQGMPSSTTSLTAIAAAFLFFFPLYYLKTLAAGDVKLLMAVGAWSDTELVIHLGLTAIFMGAIVGLIILLNKKGLQKTLSSIFTALKFESKKESQMTRMPFAPAFLCSFLILKIAEFKGWSLF